MTPFWAERRGLRAFLLMKGLLLLLAFDLWLDLLSHGGRYGVGGFNVAHFGWLDRVQPVPTPGLYVGLLSLCGLLALAMVLAGNTRLLMGLLAAGYTYSWAMSMLDSYQHHYLLSIVLVCLALLPPLRARDVLRADAPARVLWPYPLLTASLGIVYFYTAFAKLDPGWRAGHALARLARKADFAQWLQGQAQAAGVAPDEFWPLLASSVVPLQLLIALGYFVAPLLDQAPQTADSTRRVAATARWVKVLCWIALGCALSFHVGAELLGLKIGWFSYYMLLAALIVWLPTSWLQASAAMALKAWEHALAWFKEDQVTPANRWTLPLLAGAGALVAMLFGYMVDLPGVLTATVLFAGGMLVSVLRPNQTRGEASSRAWLLAVPTAAFAMWISIANSEVRFDYYRYVAGDARRRGEYRLALENYAKANLYAPADNDRREQEQDMRHRLGLPSS